MGKHLVVNRIMQGIYNSTPPISAITWGYLTDHWMGTKCLPIGLKKFSLKLAMLMALVHVGQRSLALSRLEGLLGVPKKCSMYVCPWCVFQCMCVHPWCVYVCPVCCVYVCPWCVYVCPVCCVYVCLWCVYVCPVCCVYVCPWCVYVCMCVHPWCMYVCMRIRCVCVLCSVLCVCVSSVFVCIGVQCQCLT